MQKTIKKINKTPSFEEILQLFTTLDSDDKMPLFNEKLKLYLATKTTEEKHFVGTIFLSLTRDNALRLLDSLEKRGDIAMLEEMQQMLMAFA
jgi:hypothetical protein